MAKNQEMQDLMDKFEKVGTFNNQIIIEKSKHVSLGDNKVKGTKISKTDKDARDQARFEKTKLGQEFNESETPPEEIREISLSLINKFMIDIFEI